jgi:ribonuclease HI
MQIMVMNLGISTYSMNQAATTELDNYQINSELVRDCCQFLAKLVERRVQLIWVLGYRHIVGNKIADQLVKMGTKAHLWNLNWPTAYQQILARRPSGTG